MLRYGWNELEFVLGSVIVPIGSLGKVMFLVESFCQIFNALSPLFLAAICFGLATKLWVA